MKPASFNKGPYQKTVLSRRSFSWLSKMRNQKLHLLSINWRCHPRGLWRGRSGREKIAITPFDEHRQRPWCGGEQDLRIFLTRRSTFNEHFSSTFDKPIRCFFSSPRTMTQFPILRLYPAEIRCPFHSTETNDLPEVTTLLPRHRTTPPSVCDGVR